MAKSEEPTILRCDVPMLWVPRHPVPDPMTGQIVKWRSGKIRKGEKFVWHGEGGYPKGATLISGGKRAPKPKVAKAPVLVVEGSAEKLLVEEPTGSGPLKS